MSKNCKCVRQGDFWQSYGCPVHSGMPDKNDAGPASMSDLTVMDADLAKLIIVLRKINWLDHANGGIVITQRDFDRLQKLLTQLEDKYI